jgi:hypothetical protein
VNKLDNVPSFPYEGDINGFLERAEQFFALMPDPDTERELSEHSPLYVSAAVENAENQKQS